MRVKELVPGRPVGNLRRFKCSRKEGGKGREGSWNLETFTKLREPKRCIKISSKPQGKQQALWPPCRLCKLKENAVGCIGVVLSFPEFHFALFEFVLDLTSEC